MDQSKLGLNKSQPAQRSLDAGCSPKSSSDPSKITHRLTASSVVAENDNHKIIEARTTTTTRTNNEPRRLDAAGAGARSLESLNYIGSGCQKRHQLNAMLTTEYGSIDRRFLRLKTMPVLCLLVIINVVSKPAHCNSLYSSGRQQQPQVSIGHQFEKQNLEAARDSGSSTLKLIATTARRRELRNTSATNPLQPSVELSFAGRDKEDQQWTQVDRQQAIRADAVSTAADIDETRRKANEKHQSGGARKSTDSTHNMELNASTRNSSSGSTARIHKRNKLRFDSLDNLYIGNNKSGSSDFDNNSSKALYADGAPVGGLAPVAMDDKQRMDVRHKFTFMVNGKELALNPPPKAGGDSESSSSAGQLHIKANELLDNDNVTTTKKGAQVFHKAGQRGRLGRRESQKRKINRSGEFMSSTDYESGFDVNGADSAATEPIQTSASKQHPSDSKSSRPSSSSSSLMASFSSIKQQQLQSADNDDDNNEDADDNDEPQSATLVLSAELGDNTSGSKSRNDHRNQVQSDAKRGSSDVVISDWSKPGDSAKRDQQLTSSQNKSYGSSGSRFSTLLSGSGSGSSGASNDKANQSGEQQAWDLSKYATSTSSVNKPTSGGGHSKTSAASQDAITSSAVASNDNESGYSKASVKKNPYPKAPVTAKSRYTSSPADSSVGDNIKSRSAVRQHSEPLNDHDTIGEKVANNNHNNSNDDDKHSSSSFLSAAQRNGGASLQPRDIKSSPSRSMRLARFDKSTNESNGSFMNSFPSMSNFGSADYASNSGAHSSTEYPNLVSEYKTNFSDYHATTGSGSLRQQQQQSGSGPVSNDTQKAPIVQRDLSFHRPQQPFVAISPPTFFVHQPNVIGAHSFPPNQDLITTHSRASRSGRPGAGPMFEGISNDRGFLYRDPPPPPITNTTNNNGVKSNVNNNIIDNNDNAYGNKPRGLGASQQQQPFVEVNRSSIEKMGSIVRTGPIMPHPFAHQQQLRALVPAAVALLAQAQEDQQVRAANQLRALLAAQQLPSPALAYNEHFIHSRAPTYPSLNTLSLNQNLSNGAEQMMATSNHLGVSHLGPQSMSPSLGASESNSYNSIANYPDYPDTRSPPNGGEPRDGPHHNIVDPNLGGGPSAPSATTISSILSDERRGPSSNNDYDGSSYDGPTGSSMRGGSNQNPDVSGDNSRSSMSDVYFQRQDQKQPRDSSGANYPSRNSVDPYEDVSNGISTSEYERDLADMDEEFNRAAFRRPPVSQMASDSYMNMSPDRYEGRRYARRPPSYSYFTSDYMNTAGSVSNMIPRSYHHQSRNPVSWLGSPAYSESSDLWTDTSSDYSPMSSYINPSHYSLAWKPRYHQRAYTAATAPYLAAAASEQPHHIQPAYNFIPSHYSSSLPTETVSIALSPLAAAAAAAASALAVADKSRHQNNGWLTLPRLATSALAPVSAAASTAHATTLPLQAAYYHRPSPYALGSVPIYAIAPRPTAPLAAAASAAAPSIIPYYHSAGPAIYAYRPAHSILPTGQLLTAASFAYPLRLPVHPIPRPPTLSLAPTRSIGLRPFYSDLQFAESKSKSNLTNSDNNNSKSFSKTGGSLTAMAKNLTRKMFGSASQIRPQHVAPPNPLYDLFAPAHNSTTNNFSSQIVL